MINKFGKVMLYVNNPKEVAEFWVNKIGFIQVKAEQMGEEILYEVAPNSTSDTRLVIFDRAVVEKNSPGVNLGCPSILFSSYNIKEMRDNLIEKGVTVGEIVNMDGWLTFNFSDNEGNYFAVEEVSEV